MTQDKKTLAELSSGIHCCVGTAELEMLTVQKAFGKTEGRRLVHIIQSFHPSDPVTLEQAHEIGLDFAEYFPNFQMVVATHRDTDHIHNHFVMNSVRLTDGKKFHQSAYELGLCKEYSNQLCKEHGLCVVPIKKEKRVQDIRQDEYRAAMRGISWKMRLVNVIDHAMTICHTQQDFIAELRRGGYDVRWEDDRKYITYSCPGGMKCRDNKLHDLRYTKERMTHEFDIRATESPQCRADAVLASNARSPVSSPTGHPLPLTGQGGLGEPAPTLRPAGEPHGTAGTATVSTAIDQQTGCRGDKEQPCTDEVDVATGWEKERKLLFHPEVALAQLEYYPQSAMAANPSDAAFLVGTGLQITGVVAALVGTAAKPVLRIQDCTTMGRFTIDRRRLQELYRKYGRRYDVEAANSKIELVGY